MSSGTNKNSKMTTRNALVLLLEAIEHLAYRQKGEYFIQRRMEDDTLISADEWHYSEAIRLLNEVKEEIGGLREKTSEGQEQEDTDE